MAWLVALALFLGAAGLSARTQAAEFQVGQNEIRLDLRTDLQGAYATSKNRESGGTDYEIDWTVRGEVRRILSNGLLVGAVVEVDQDFDVDSDADASGEIELDEAYLYLASRWGRIELGRQDGPADALAYHAPVVGTGQIRGDFARYASGRALLSTFDTRDAAKIVYLSPPLKGLRFGASYGPNLVVGTDQRNHVEAAVQYNRVVGDVALGVSGTYVRASADPTARRQDINSWSVGAEARKNKMRIGGAFVVRGDSNSLQARDEKEVNLGIGWYENRWQAAASVARIRRFQANRNLFGVGGSYDLTKWAVLRGDVVYFDEDRIGSSTDERGVVALMDLRLQY